MAALRRTFCVLLIFLCFSNISWSEDENFTVVFSFQNYTYLLEKENLDAPFFTCDPLKSECKVNLDFRSSFTDAYPARDYRCVFSVSFDPDYLPTDPCNPPNFIVPSGQQFAYIQIFSKSDDALVGDKVIYFSNESIPDKPLETGSGSTHDDGEELIEIPAYSVRVQSGVDENFICKKSDCKLNLIVEGLNSDFACRWDFGGGMFTTAGTEENCNPGYIQYSTGEYDISLEVYQKNLTTNTTQVSFHLINQIGLSAGGSGSTSVSPLRAKITLQGVIGSNKRFDGNTLYCVTTDTCSVNLDGRESTGEIVSYQWQLGPLGEDDSDNPAGFHLPLGKHKITLTVSDRAGNLDTDTFEVIVTQPGSTPTVSDQPLKAIITLQGVIGSNKTLEGNHLTCRTKDTCSLNFDGSQSSGSIVSYDWDLGSGIVSSDKNPAAYRLGFGTYTIVLQVQDHFGGLSRAKFFVDVIDTYSQPIEELECGQECTLDVNIQKVSISRVSPNPHHKDTLEWIELTNESSSKVRLWGCQLDDISDGGSKPFSLDGLSIASKSVLRLYKTQTKLNLNNDTDTVQFICQGELIDSLSWNFPVPSGYIFDAQIVKAKSVFTTVNRALDGDTIEVIINGKAQKVRMLGVDTPETVDPRKSVQYFGEEASRFTKSSLTGKNIWLTFDHQRIDAYGRMLAYVWVGDCNDGDFTLPESTSCELFNASLLEKGFARMERRFSFYYYDAFDRIEKTAKKNSTGLWADKEVSNILEDLSDQEEEIFDQELEQDFLEEQEIYLAQEVPGELLDTGAGEYEKHTLSFSTMKVSQRKDTSVRIYGQTWPDSQLEISIGRKKFTVVSDSVGKYELVWIPDNTGFWDIGVVLKDDKGGIRLGTKQILVDHVLENFIEPLETSIQVQGSFSKNRWISDGVFFCRSRTSCSVNLIADVGQRKFIEFVWHYPGGVVFEKQNPPSVKFSHGRHEVILEVRDLLTGETLETTLSVQSLPLLTSPKKSNVATNKKVKFVSNQHQSEAKHGSLQTKHLSSFIILTIIGGTLLLHKVSVRREDELDT